MKKVKLGSLLDGDQFQIGCTKSAKTYKVICKNKGGTTTYTQLDSERSGTKPNFKQVFIIN